MGSDSERIEEAAARVSSAVMAVRTGGGSRDIQSLHRAFDILETLGHGSDLGVTEIAKKTSLPVSTVHNLLRTMAKRHYVVGTNGRYQLGPAMTVLTSSWDPVRSMSHAIQRQIDVVIKVTGQTAFGTMMVGDRARVIAFHPGPGPITVNENYEDNGDPLEIATGRLLVAMTREAEWDRFISAAGDVEAGWDRQHWRNELRAIAASGVCVRHLPSVAESTAVVIALPVWGPNGAIICSIGSGVPTFRITPELVEHTIDAIWEASLALSAGMGCEEPPIPRPDLRVPALRDLAAINAG